MYIFLETYVPWDVVDFGGKGCKLVQDLVHVLMMLVKHLLRAVVGVALDRNSSKVTRQQNNVHPIKCLKNTIGKQIWGFPFSRG